MNTLPRFALIVGVSDYSAFDHSRGEATGTSDLPGAVRDALGYVNLALHAGVPPANIRLLLSPAEGDPPLDAQAIPDGVIVERATRANVLAGLGALAEGLDSSDDAVGMFSFAGHGSADDQALLLCCADTTVNEEGDALLCTVSFPEIEEKLGEASQRGALTVFLETCHAGGSRRRKTRAIGLLNRPISETLAERSLQLDAAILAACRPDWSAFEVPIGASYRGAFSHSVQLALARFASDEADAPFGLNSLELINRSRDLIEALGVPQRPVLRGAIGRLAAPILAPRGSGLSLDGLRPLLSDVGRAAAGSGESGGAALVAQSASSSTTSTTYRHYTLVIRKKVSDYETPVVWASGGHVFVIGNSAVTGKDSDPKFQPNRAYWYFPQTTQNDWNTRVNPFTLDKDGPYSFALIADPSYLITWKKAHKAEACFMDNAFGAASGSVNLNNSYNYAITYGQPATSPPIGYLSVTTVGTIWTSSGTQTWVLSSATTEAGKRLFNLTPGSYMLFTPTSSTSTPTGTWCSTTDAWWDKKKTA